MSKRILIDLEKCRNCKECTVECEYGFHPENNGMRTLRELAVLNFTCRRCEDAPCMLVCPEDALERDEKGIIIRASNLCVGCKSCIAICPFGTIMNDVFAFKKSICNYCKFDDETKTLKCIDTCPEKAISFIETEADENEGIYKLNDKVLVKEYVWEKLIKE